MKFHVLTLFPEMIIQGLGTSIMGRALESGAISLSAVNIRDFSEDKHKKVDDYTYGGGAGMLMQAQPVYDAWKSVADKIGYAPRTVYLTPQGHTFTQPMAKELAKEEDLVLLCGHYEGIDERVLEEIVPVEKDKSLLAYPLPYQLLIGKHHRQVPPASAFRHLHHKYSHLLCYVYSLQNHGYLLLQLSAIFFPLLFQ